MKTHPTFDYFGLTIEGQDDPDLENLDTEEVKKLFKSNGALLFSGFDVNVEKFEKFTNLFSDNYMDHTGGGSLRKVINKDGDGTILSVDYSYDKKKSDFESGSQKTFPLPLHSDRSYTKTQPPLMWFYCVQPAKEIGETILCDGVGLYEEFSSDTRNFLSKNPIKYIRNYPDGEWQLWAKSESIEGVRRYCDENDLVLTVNPDKSITTESTKMAVVKPRWTEHTAFVNSILIVQWQEDAMSSNRSIVRMHDGSRIPEDILAEIRGTSDRLTREVSWKPGQIAMVDNTRMLHGRREFNDRNREIYVRMARSVDW